MSDSQEPFADIVDAQIHLYDAHSDERPWDPDVLANPRYEGMRGRFAAHTATPAEVIDLMDSEGVAGALAVTSGVYGYDNSYSVYAYEFAPDRFRAVGFLDSSRNDLEDAVAACAESPAYAGLRLNLESDEAVQRYFDRADDRLLAAAAKHQLVVCVLSPGRFNVFEDIAQRFPELPVVVDHLGLFSVAMLDPTYTTDPFAKIGGLPALGAYPNVSVKVTSVPMLSRAEYPFDDVWPHLHRVIEAFGVERLFWGSDAIVFDPPYDQMIGFLRDTDELSRGEKEWILGKALRKVWGWPLQDPSQSAEDRAVGP